MIPGRQLDVLIAYSTRNDDGDLILRDDAPKSVIALAKEFHWAPYKDGYLL